MSHKAAPEELREAYLSGWKRGAYQHVDPDEALIGPEVPEVISRAHLLGYAAGQDAIRHQEEMATLVFSPTLQKPQGGEA